LGSPRAEKKGERKEMRCLLKPEYSTDVAIAKIKDNGDLPNGVEIKTDTQTGRRYFNWVYRLSTDIDWNKIGPFVEAVSNLVTMYCDLVEEGIYETKYPRIIAIVILKRNPVSGVTWEEVEFYGGGVTPKDIGDAHYRFRQKEMSLTAKWSSGEPHK